DAELGYVMTHAGIPPIWSVQQTMELAAEVETILRCDKRLPDYLDEMYGNEPARWKPGLKGIDRLRAITNYLTRMRFCKPDGTLEFKSKEGLDTTPKGFAPWFRYPRRDPDIQVIFGHWAAIEGRTGVQGVHALDTGCVWGGRMTLMNLDTHELHHCDCAT
ncbi:MAG TPA: symmetrical bis(5'-nucleosyl)-tetraphosphatase, partial [Pseudomonas sp.]|nr:symmetrical bis(5'-nucleosyl)-tetraphosphatase [Pseudomonas sp.]